TDIASSLTCIVVMVLVMKFWKPKNIMHLEGEQPVTHAAHRHSASAVFVAWLPYLLLGAIVLFWGSPGIKAALNRFSNGLLPASVPRSPTLLNGLLVPGLHNLVERVPPVVAKPTPYAAV